MKMKHSAAKDAAKVAKMLAGHPDLAEDKALVRKMVRPEALTGKAKGGACRASGGETSKKKPHVQLNVVIAPRGTAPRAKSVEPATGSSLPPSPSPLASLGQPVKTGGTVKSRRR